MDKTSLLAVSAEAANSGWSLHSDVQLQRWLEGFAEQLKRRTESVAKQVEQLGDQTSDVELNLHNTFNSFRALSTSQFIENRVYEEDETLAVTEGPQTSKVHVEGYESDIIPRYKEAVLLAWSAFEGLSGKQPKRAALVPHMHRASARVERDRMRQRPKLPYIIGTEEFARDSCCGLAESPAGTSSSDMGETDSDTERDEAHMAAEMLGVGVLSDEEWSGTESEISGHQGGGLEPAVSAALDFKAMLEAALRGPSLPYEDSMLPTFENTGYYNDVEADTKLSNSARTRSKTVESKLQWDMPAAAGQGLASPSSQKEGSFIEDYMGDCLVSPASDQADKTSTLISTSPEHISATLAYGDILKMAAKNDSYIAQSFSGQHSPSHFSSARQAVVNHLPSQQDRQSRSKLGHQTTPNSRDTAPVGAIGSPQPPLPGVSLGLYDDDDDDESDLVHQKQGTGRMPISDSAPMPTVPDMLFRVSETAKVGAERNKSRSSSSDSQASSGGTRVQPDVPPVNNGNFIFVEKNLPVRQLSIRPDAETSAARPSETLIVRSSESSLTSKHESSSGTGSGPGPRVEKTLQYQGGLFDDEDEDEDTAVTLFDRREFSGDQKGVIPSNIIGRDNYSALRPWMNGGGSKRGLFDDFNETLLGPSTASETLVGNAKNVIGYFRADPRLSGPEASSRSQEAADFRGTFSGLASQQFSSSAMIAGSENHATAPQLHPLLSRVLDSHERPTLSFAGNSEFGRLQQDENSEVAGTLRQASNHASLAPVEKEILLGPTAAVSQAASNKALQPRSNVRSSANRIGDPVAGIETMEEDNFHNEGERETPSEDPRQDFASEIHSPLGGIEQSLTSQGIDPARTVNSASSLQVIRGSVVAVMEVTEETQGADGVNGNTAKILAAVVTSNRRPAVSDSEDDDSISWSSSGSEEHNRKERGSITDEGKEQVSVSRASADGVVMDSHHQFDHSGSSGSSLRDAELHSQVPVADTVSEVYSPPSINTQGFLAGDTRTSTAPTTSARLDLIAPVPLLITETVRFSSADSGRSLQSAHSSGPNMASSDQGSRRGTSFISTERSPFKVEPRQIRASVQAIITWSFGTGEGVRQISVQKFKSLFEDDDDSEEDLFLPRPTQALVAEKVGVGKTSRPDWLSNLSPSSSRSHGAWSSSTEFRAETTARTNVHLQPASATEVIHEDERDSSMPRVSKKMEMDQSENTGKKEMLASLLHIKAGEAQETGSLFSAEASNRHSGSTTKSVSSLLFGDEDDDGEDALFGPLGGRAQTSSLFNNQGKSASLFDSAGSESFLKGFTVKHLPSAQKESRTKEGSPSTRLFGRGSLFEDDDES